MDHTLNGLYYWLLDVFFLYYNFLVNNRHFNNFLNYLLYFSYLNNRNFPNLLLNLEPCLHDRLLLNAFDFLNFCSILNHWHNFLYDLRNLDNPLFHSVNRNYFFHNDFNRLIPFRHMVYYSLVFDVLFYGDSLGHYSFDLYNFWHFLYNFHYLFNYYLYLFYYFYLLPSFNYHLFDDLNNLWSRNFNYSFRTLNLNNSCYLFIQSNNIVYLNNSWSFNNCLNNALVNLWNGNDCVNNLGNLY